MIIVMIVIIIVKRHSKKKKYKHLEILPGKKSHEIVIYKTPET